jgi:hypothetical protein
MEIVSIAQEIKLTPQTTQTLRASYVHRFAKHARLTAMDSFAKLATLTLT